MITVTADATLQALLGQVTEEAEIRDARGNVLGYYTPRARAEAKLYEQARKLFDPEEMKRRKEAEHGTGATTAELLARLESLGTSG